MSLIEEALKRAKRDATKPESRPRSVPATQAAPHDAPPVMGRLAARLAGRPQIELDREFLRRSGLAPLPTAERRLTSEYRAIKRGLLAAMTRSPTPIEGKSVMVASAVPGEGKTFTSLNLALSLAAERDWTVVLIDADSAKQHLSSTFGLRDQRGLLDALSDPSVSLIDVMYRTSVPGLNFISAGQAPEASTELMASARMAGVLQQLFHEDPRTIVVFDSSPLLLTTDSRALADAVDQVLLVVRADSTPRASVTEAIAALGEGHQVGLVLNEYQGSALHQDYYAEPDSARTAAG
jgi:exopolysaccharide/PEP-CTERM locus tyrosine autokinase